MINCYARFFLKIAFQNTFIVSNYKKFPSVEFADFSEHLLYNNLTFPILKKKNFNQNLYKFDY